MSKTITVEDRSYEIAPMTLGQGRAIFTPDKEMYQGNCEMVAACLNNAVSNADCLVRTAKDIDEMSYQDGIALVLACLELNGLRAKTPGEAAAAQKPA